MGGDNISIYTDISSTSDSEILEQEERSAGSEADGDFDLSAILPTLEEIVREEWSMIPETEGEDEGKENEIEEELKQESLKQKKKRKKDKKNKKDKKKRETDRMRKNEMDQNIKNADEKPHNESIAEGEVQEVSTSAPLALVEERSVIIQQIQQEQESPFISSGFWSTIDKLSSFGLSTSHKEFRLSRKLRKIRKTAAYYTGLHGVMSGKGRVVSGNEKMGGEINETDLGMIRRRLAAIEAARKRVASAAPDASAIRSAKRAAYAKVPLWRRPIARLIRRPGNVTATARVATSAPTSQLLLEDNYEKNDGSSPNLSD
eukprot:scaffold11672_cov195-Chaetoceros_neogracile.AAC.1